MRTGHRRHRRSACGLLRQARRRQSTRSVALIREHGGVPVDSKQPDIDLVVIGADELPLADDESLTPDLRAAATSGQTKVIHETELWERLGLVPSEGSIRQLYTPAMLADLLDVPIAVVRRWHRRGLIVPIREVHRLPYFDFKEVATAQYLAKLLAAGASAVAIEKKLDQLSRWVPEVDRPLAQLSVIVEGRDLLMRQGEGLIGVDGQRRFDFDASDTKNQTTSDSDIPTDENGEPAVFSVEDYVGNTDELELQSRSQLLQQAAQLEEDGALEEAVNMYRAILAIDGPDAEVNFQMAELLYRMGDISAARERYYTALELDDDYVEARANLGCVLAETGQSELAVAAFQGALARHEDYPDVHYHLARTLDELERHDESLAHWKSFLTLAPDSPWATEARDRLGLRTESL